MMGWNLCLLAKFLLHIKAGTILAGERDCETDVEELEAAGTDWNSA